MYLADTNAISELRKGAKADRGLVQFLRAHEGELFLPVQVVGELVQGIERLRNRNDTVQAARLEAWLLTVVEDFEARILPFDLACAEAWGRLMGAKNQNPIDRQIAAVAIVYDLTIVTRNIGDFEGTGARLVNPFWADQNPGASGPRLVQP